MQLRDLQRHWHEFGRRDPLWAILTLPGKRNARWDLDEFFLTGRQEIGDVMASLDGLGLPRPTRRALDFGCGVGRLTQALCEHTAAATGVDIAPSMVEQARQFNRHGSRCEYVLNEADDLRGFADASFDFVYSRRVLQHMRPDYALAYIGEFVRILAPGGVAVFQVPTDPSPDPKETAPPAPSSEIAAAMPESAYLVEIVPEVTALSAPSGGTIEIAASMRNTSPHTWPCQALSNGDNPIKLGNHWLDAAGTMLVQDDGRALLDRDLAPGQTVRRSLTASVPLEPGDYWLELDLVHDWICWFADRGSPAPRIAVKVRTSLAERARAAMQRLRPRPEPAAGGVDVPVMEMYRVPIAEVARLVEAGGAAIVDQRPDWSGGANWGGYLFFVHKRRA